MQELLSATVSHWQNSAAVKFLGHLSIQSLRYADVLKAYFKTSSLKINKKLSKLIEEIC
jgi:hypothetical protein